MDSFKVTGRLDMVHYTPRDENIALVNSFFDQKALESLGNLDSLITVNALGANIRHGISYTRDMDELNWPFVVKWTDSYEPYIVPCINEQHHTMFLLNPEPYQSFLEYFQESLQYLITNIGYTSRHATKRSDKRKTTLRFTVNGELFISCTNFQPLAIFVRNGHVTKYEEKNTFEERARAAIGYHCPPLKRCSNCHNYPHPHSPAHKKDGRFVCDGCTSFEECPTFWKNKHTEDEPKREENERPVCKKSKYFKD